MATYTIEIFSRGMEIGIGKISKEQYEFWSERDDEELSDALNENLEYTDVYPESVRFTSQYYEYNDVACNCGADIENSNLTIKDEDGNEIYDGELQSFFNEETGNEENIFEENGIWENDLDPGYYVYWIQGGKGCYFEGEIECNTFDPKKLVVKSEVISGNEIVSTVEYDGQEVDNSGGDWWGKYADYRVFQIKGE
jgi:hypothetical protein